MLKSNQQTSDCVFLASANFNNLKNYTYRLSVPNKGDRADNLVLISQGFFLQ